jgi:multidrug efflux system membrane fusion protein
MHGELPKKQLTGAPTRRGRRRLATALVLAAVAGALAYVYYPTPPAQTSLRSRLGAASGPIPVLAATARRTDVAEFLDAVGTARAINTVTVRPQVDGKLIAVTFREGEDVKQGDVLARIDPTIYQAQLDQALAKKAQDEALLANARNDLARYERLAAANAINKQQADTQKATVAQYEAQVKADAAAVENAQATLGYTTITAPIAGRTGFRMVDEGNSVRASDAGSAIVTITQLKPMSVQFNLPQQDLARVNDAFARGPLAAEALRSDTDEVIDRGRLTVVDNQVDSATGTVKLKAEFPNPDLRLWPGQFVNVRLKIDTLRQVVVIPTGAVQRGPDGTFVYVIDADSKAVVRRISVRRQEETETVVARGLEPGERVVTTGFARLTDGAGVTVSGAAPGARPGNGGRPAAASQSGERPRRAGDGQRPNPQQ